MYRSSFSLRGGKEAGFRYYVCFVNLYVSMGSGCLRCEEINISATVKMKNLMKDLKALLGEFRDWPIVGFFIERLIGIIGGGSGKVSAGGL